MAEIGAPKQGSGKRRRKIGSERQKSIRRVLWGIVLIGLLASLWSASRRWKVEGSSRGVEIVLDFGELRTLSSGTGQPLGDVLRRFREAGATSVALDEDTIGGLEGARRLTVMGAPDRTTTILRFGPDMSLYERIFEALTHKTHWHVTPIGQDRLRIDEPYGQVRGVGVGLDRGVAAGIRKAGLRIVGRVNNYIGVDGPGITWTCDQLRQAGASTILFLGDDVLGNKGLVAPPKGADATTTVPPTATTMSAMEADSLNLGTVEFGKQKGDPELQRAMPDRTIRVHTVLGSEMPTADIPTNIQRFLLAARERNIRMLFVRLFLAEPDPIKTNADDYVAKIHEGLSRARPHLYPGQAVGFAPLSTPRWVILMVCLGLSAGWLLLYDSITGLFRGGVGPLGRFMAIAGAVVLLLLSVYPGLKGAQYAALAAACLYSSLAVLHRDLLRPDNGFKPIQSALLRFLMTCAITSIGIAAIAGLLADRIFLLKMESFIGVKATLVVPVLLATLVYGLDLRATEKRTWGQAVRSTWDRCVRISEQPILLWQVIVGVAALVVLAFLVMRSGNDPGVGVSASELKLRSLLDHYLPARPRFKDLFGHPALVLGLALAARGRRSWALPLLLIGVIGQASLLNAFCHLHTPLPASITRALLGITFGVIIGPILHFLLNAFVLRYLPAAPAVVETTAAVSPSLSDVPTDPSLTPGG